MRPTPFTAAGSPHGPRGMRSSISGRPELGAKRTTTLWPSASAPTTVQRSLLWEEVAAKLKTLADEVTESQAGNSISTTLSWLPEASTTKMPPIRSTSARANTTSSGEGGPGTPSGGTSTSSGL